MMNVVRLRMTQLAVVVLALVAPLPAQAQVEVKNDGEQITVDIDGKPFTVIYIGGKDLNRPYLHPLRPPPARSSTARFRPANCQARRRIIRIMPDCITATAM